jgi:hypothetical protein
MDPSNAKSISDQVQSKFEWKQEKLVFSLPMDGDEDIEFDIVPYLGGDLMGANLTFPNPNMEQKELISLLKQQASKQGVRLTTVASSANSEARSEMFAFQWLCYRNRLSKRPYTMRKVWLTAALSFNPEGFKKLNYFQRRRQRFPFFPHQEL